MRKIAIEEHFIDPDQVRPTLGDAFTAEFAQPGSSYGGFNPEFAEVVRARLDDLGEGRLAEMDAPGIDIAVLSHTIGGVEGVADPVVTVATAARVNDFLAAQVASGGGRFAGLAILPLQDVAAAVLELRRAVAELALVGVMVNGFTDLGTEKRYLDEDRFDPLWAVLEELGVPLYLHPRLPARAVQEVIYRGPPELVGATWGFAPETATHVLRIVYRGFSTAARSATAMPLPCSACVHEQIRPTRRDPAGRRGCGSRRPRGRPCRTGGGGHRPA